MENIIGRKEKFWIFESDEVLTMTLINIETKFRLDLNKNQEVEYKEYTYQYKGCFNYVYDDDFNTLSYEGKVVGELFDEDSYIENRISEIRDLLEERFCNYSYKDVGEIYTLIKKIDDKYDDEEWD